MKIMELEEITDVSELGEKDCLFIEFKENKEYFRNCFDNYFVPSNYFVNIFNGRLYVFDKEKNLKLRIETDCIEKMLKLRFFND